MSKVSKYLSTMSLVTFSLLSSLCFLIDFKGCSSLFCSSHSRVCFIKCISKGVSPNIVRVIKSWKMRWVGHVARMDEERGCIGSWWGNRREKDHWGDLGVDGWIILGWISRRWDVGIWTGLGLPRVGTGGGRLWVREWTFGFGEMRGISW